MRKVFISYADQDETWVREWLIPRFTKAGVESRDFRNFQIGAPRLECLVSEVEAADYVLLILSPNWLNSELDHLVAHLLQSDDPTNRKRKMLPLQLDACDIPGYLKGFQLGDFKRPDDRETEMQRLLQQIGALNSAISIRSKPDFISLSRLPDTSGLLFGRDKELKLLDEAWADHKTNIVTFVAQGGEGKTALVGEWLNQMAKDAFRGAAKVYGFSFYSQGSEQDRQVSGDPFLVDALISFGDSETANSPHSAFQKAQRLAVLIRQQPTLLILDGVEPLQYPPGAPHHGKMRDEGVRTLIKELARANNGLCLVSTRVSIKELDTFKTGGVVQQDLPHLTEDAGAELLEAYGANGSRVELKKVSAEYKGHALALTLLGRLLAVHLGGDIRKRDLIPALTDEDEYGGHAKRVLAYYSEMFQDKPELGIMRILGLFDRPAEESAIKMLRQPPMILGITNGILALKELEWNNALKHLRDLRILEEGSKLDCHPLIREYFSMQVREQYKAAWKEAHKRLYKHYKGLAPSLPNTMEEMEPLYRAMNHGSKASMYQEAFDDVFKIRIVRGDQAYSIQKLGAYSSTLSAIAGLFREPWLVVQSQLNASSRSYLLNASGFCLQGLGRLREAIEPLEAGLEKRIEQGNWKSASEPASNLSQLYLTLGETTLAMENALKAVKYADSSGDLQSKVSRKALLANVLFQTGEMVKAEALFREAEESLLQNQSTSTMVFSEAGYNFSSILIANADWVKVMERTSEILELAKQGEGTLLNIAFGHLSVGTAAYLQAIAQGTGDTAIAKYHIDEAVDVLRASGNTNDVPHGLLARAALLRDIQNYKAAQADLNEVLEIAYPEMRLHLTDYHLEAARLCLAMGSKHTEAQDHYEKAKKLIDETGYHRRDKELEALKDQLKQ